jgi:hypothetical protein
MKGFRRLRGFCVTGLDIVPDLYIADFILFGIVVGVFLAGRYGRPREP